MIKAVVEYYARYQGDKGTALLAQQIRIHLGLEGDEVAKTLDRARKDLERLESTTRRLLDNVTPATRAAVERRLKELEGERERLRAKIESLERLGMSKAEVRDLIQETTAFIARLGPTLREGALHERQAAMRRCVNAAMYNHSERRVRLETAIVPASITGLHSGMVQIEFQHEGRPTSVSRTAEAHR